MDNNLPEGPKRPPLIFWLFIIVFITAVALGGTYLYLSRTGSLVQLLPKLTTLKNIGVPNMPTPPPTSVPSPIPSPTPLLGPGTYACDTLGICNIYQNPKDLGCPETFADPHCLGKCADKSKRCPK